MANDFFKHGLKVSEQKLININKHLEAEHQKSVTEMFARIGEGRTYAPTESYDRRDHVISGFSNKNDAMLFVKHMSDSGKKAVVAPVKVNGQWLVDVRVNATKSEQEAYKKEVENFSEKNHINPQGQHTWQSRLSEQNYNQSGSSIVHETENLFKQELGSSEETRKLIHIASTAMSIADKYNKADNDSAFHQSGNIAEADTVYKATVVGEKGDYTVIVNGKILDNDSKEAKRIIKKHEERLEKARKNVSGTKGNTFLAGTTAVADSLKGKSAHGFSKSFKEIQSSSQTILDKSMKQEYYSREVKTNVFNGGVLDTFIAQANTLRIIENKRSPKNVTRADGTVKNLNFTADERATLAKLAGAGVAGADEARLFRGADGIGTVTDYRNRIDLTNALLDMKGKGVVSDSEIQEIVDKVKLEPSEQTMFLPKQEGAVGYSFDKNGRSENTLSKIEKDLGVSFGGNITREKMMNANDKLFEKVSLYNQGVASHNEGVRNGTITGDLKEPIILFKNGEFDKQALIDNCDKIGISKETAETFGKLNEKNQFGNLTKEAKEKIIGGVAGIFTKNIDDQETQQVIRQGQQMYNYGKQLSSTVEYAQRSLRIAGEKHKMNRAKAPKKVKTKPAKPKTKKQIERAEKKSLKSEKKAKKHTDKMKKKAKRMEKFENSALGKAFNLKKKLEKKVAELLSPFTAVKAYVMHIVGAGAMVLVTLMGGLVIVIIAIVGIQNLLAIPDKLIMGALAPDTYEDTAMYELYKQTKKTEDGEIEKLNDFAGMLENRYSLSFGDNYSEYSDYISNIGYLYDDGETLYINPFNISADDEDNKKYMKKVTYINGEKDITFKANANPFAEISDSDERFVSTESGHTANIKDILCMVDVMYKYDSDNFSDDAITSVLGMSPKQLEYTEFKDSFLGACKAGWKNMQIKAEKVINWIATFIFGQDNVEEISEEQLTNRYAESSDGIISWKAIQLYVESVYNASHQETYDFDVNFYEKSTALDSIDKYEQEYYENNACVHGYCINPDENDFKIGIVQTGYDSNSKIVTPYIQTGSEKKLLYSSTNSETEKKNAITVDMRDYAGEIKDLCIPIESKDSARPTLVADPEGASYTWIKTHSTNSDYNPSGENHSPECWKMEEENISDDESKKIDGSEVMKKTVTATSGWFESYDKAKADLDSKLQQLYNDHTVAGDTYNYNGFDIFTRNYSVKPDFSVNVTNDENRPYNELHSVDIRDCQVSDGHWQYWQEEGDHYTIVIRSSGGSWWKNTFANDYLGLKVKLGTSSAGYELWGMTRSGLSIGEAIEGGILCVGWGNNHYEFKNEWLYDNENENKGDVPYNNSLWSNGSKGWAYTDGSNYWDDKVGYKFIDVVSGHWKTMYQVKGTAVVEERHREVFTRECEGHPFKYCGGHLDTTASCNVYSFTNEQMAMAGAYDSPEEIPQVADFMTEERKKFYGTIEGKSITSKVKRDTIANASTTGQGLGVTETPQGSFIGSQYGLNLYVNGSQWGEDIVFPESRRSNIKFARDIFDIDWLITKGYNVFPLSNPPKKDEENDPDETINKAWKNYEGWNADNMTIACLKETANWVDMYEFDIPTEVDSFSISSKDRETLLEAIKRDYGEDISEDRLKMVETALAWVGRGHYTEEPEHLEHEFLSETCTTNNFVIEVTDKDGNVSNTEGIDFSASCTATDSEGFALYCLRASGVPDNNLRGEIEARLDSFAYMTTGISQFKPADIIVHKAKEWKNDNISDVDLKKYGSEYAYDIYSIYVGTFSEEITIGDINNVINIPANEPVIIDIFKGVDIIGNTTENQKSNYGYSCGIKLRYGKNDDYFFNDDHTCWCWLTNNRPIYRIDYEDIMNTMTN